jgi:hypothetical protein
MRDMPYIDAVIAGFCTSCDEPSSADQAMAFDASLEKSVWAIVPADKIESDAKVIAALRERQNRAIEFVADLDKHGSIDHSAAMEIMYRITGAYEQTTGETK